MGRQTTRPRLRPRMRMRIGFDVLEGRTLMDAGPNEITALYQNGFTPTSLHLNGSAALAGTRLRLTDGSPNENASAFTTTPVDVSRSFTTSFQFQLSAVGSAPLGEGFTFDIQNEAGIATLQTGRQDALGLTQGPHFAIKFDTENNSPNPNWQNVEYSDNSTELFAGTSFSGYNDSAEIDIPKALIDLHSGHVFQVVLQYTAPGSTTPGQLVETINDTATGSSWSHTYANVNIQGLLQLTDVTGQFAYAGFTASTGSPANNGTGYVYGKGLAVQDVLAWSWHDGTESSQLPYQAQFVLSNAKTTAASILDAIGNVVRTLWQVNPLAAGTYNAFWDGLDAAGNVPNAAKNPGPYRFQVIESAETTTRSVIANDTRDPSNGLASISSLGMFGVAVRQDGSSIWAATLGGDTAGGGSVKQFDASGNVNAQATAKLANSDIGSAVAIDSGYLYLAVEVGGWSNQFGIDKINLSNYDQTTGFTDYGHVNADGSRVAFNGNNYYLSVLSNSPHYWSLPGIAVTNYADPSHGSLWVTDTFNNLVHQYDKVTGDQVGAPISVEAPTGVTVDAAGNLWVAHSAASGGPATVVSVYSASGVFLRNVSEITGLKGVLSLAIGGGKLYAADNLAGRVDVYTISGTGVTNGGSPQQVGKPGSFGGDTGGNVFWDLRSVSVDQAGNIYTVQNTVSPSGAKGSQLEKWSPGGVSLWVKGGYEYQSVAGAYTPSNPTTVYSSSLHRYTVDPSAGSWNYAGTVAYPGWNNNKWSGLTTAASPAPPRFVHLGNTDFLTLSTGDRMIFYRINADGSLHPSTIVGTAGLVGGDAWTWNDPLGDGLPQDGQIRDSGRNPGALWQLHVDGNGNLWYQANSASDHSTVFQVPLQGLDARGNPVYDWTKAVSVFSVPVATAALAVGDDGVYVETVDPTFGPESSSSAYAGYSVGGANALYKYDLAGNLLWRVALAEYSWSLDTVPGGGAVVGSMIGSRIYHVAANGQVIGGASPLSTGDWLDFRGGSIVVNRNPRDGKIDIFTEGIGYSDSPWYRIDDSTPNTTLQATAVAGSTVKLWNQAILATPPASPSTPALLASSDSGTVGDAITNATQPVLVGSAPAGMTVQLLNANGGAVIGSATVTVAGAYSLMPSTPLSDGSYTLEVRAVDAQGESSAASGSLTVTIMANPPAAPAAPRLLPSQAVGGTSRTTQSRPTLVGAAGAGNKVDLLDASGNVLASTTAAAGGAYQLQPSVALLPGAITLRVRQRDAAGNISLASAAFTLTIADAAASDFDGDGRTDMAVFRPSSGQWIVRDSSGAGSTVATFGQAGPGDIPVPGDYDGVGHVELAVFRPSTGQWIIQGSTGTRIVAFGAPNLQDVPVPGDYDGVGHTEIAVYRPSTGQWFVLGPGGGHLAGTFGTPNLIDIPVPGDYDGVGHTELAVFRPSTAQWLIQGSSGIRAVSFGARNLFDIPVPGDYDGIGRTEPAVFRPSTAQWIVLGPSGGHVLGTMGATKLADIPLEAPIGSLQKLGMVGGIRLASIASPQAITTERTVSIAEAQPAVVATAIEALATEAFPRRRRDQ